MRKPRYTKVLYKDPLREDFVLERTGHGDQAACISWPAHAKPYINRRHVDGPVLVCRNGEMRWLTPFERLCLRLGRTDAYKLEKKYRPHLQEPPLPFPLPNPETSP